MKPADAGQASASAGYALDRGSMLIVFVLDFMSQHVSDLARVVDVSTAPFGSHDRCSLILRQRAQWRIQVI